MPRGIADIPTLRLEALNKLIETFQTPPSLMLSNMFPSSNEDSDTIKWESSIGNRGLTPFVAPGDPAPKTAPPGLAQHSAKAAYWKEIISYDEEFLNNLRAPGTTAKYMKTATRLAKDMMMLRNRSDRRKEYMFAKMLVDGSLTYVAKGGTEISLDYDIPTDNQVSLSADYYWDDGSKRNIVGDVMDAAMQIHDGCNGKVDFMLLNTNVLKTMAMDSGIQTLLTKSAFGQGDLFGKTAGGIIAVNPNVLGSLLGISNVVVYDEKYTAKKTLTANIAASGTSVYVEDASDFTTGAAKLYDRSAGTNESVTISAVNYDTGVLTVGATTSAFKSGEDYIEQAIPFIPNTKVVFGASTVDGVKIAEFMKAPFGIARTWGRFVDRKDQWDPEEVRIRCQNKGLPVLYHRDAIYQLTVKD